MYLFYGVGRYIKNILFCVEYSVLSMYFIYGGVQTYVCVVPTSRNIFVHSQLEN
jgi:hypothetical protein